MQPGLDHPAVLLVFSVCVATSAVFSWLAISNAMTLRVLEASAVRRYVAFSIVGALQAAVVALSFVPMDGTLKTHLFRLMWVLAILSTATWVRAVSAFIGARGRLFDGLGLAFAGLAVVPATDLVLALGTGHSFFFSHAPRDPASLLIAATGNHHSHRVAADLCGLAFTVLILTTAGLLIRRVARDRPRERVLMFGIALTAVAAAGEAALAVAAPGWMVPLLFAGNVLEALRITWSTTRSVGVRLLQARQDEVAQRELLAHQLEQLHLTRRLAALGSRAAELGHDLRNPLTAAVLSLEYAEDHLDRPGPVQREELREILGLGRRSLDDVVELVQRIRLSAAPAPRNDLIDLVEIAADAQDLCVHRLDGVVVSVAPPADGCTARVRGDRVDLTRIVVNLLVNAARATEPLPERWIRILVEVQADEAVLSVIDAGQTPPPAVLDQMFRRGFSTRVAPEVPAGDSLGDALVEPQTSLAGHGLGLAICRRLAAAHGGSLDVDRSARHTTLVLRLPLAQPGGVPARENPPTLSPDRPRPGSAR